MLLVGYFSRRIQFKDRIVVTSAMGIAILAVVFLFDWGVSRIAEVALFTTGALLFVGGSNASKTFLKSMLIKLCPPRLNGHVMVCFCNFICLGRLLGSVLGQYLRIPQDQQAFSATLLVLYAACIILVSIYFRRLP